MFYWWWEQGSSYRWLVLQRQKPPHSTSRIKEYCLLNQALDLSTQREPRQIIIIILPVTVKVKSCEQHCPGDETRIKLLLRFVSGVALPTRLFPHRIALQIFSSTCAVGHCFLSNFKILGQWKVSTFLLVRLALVGFDSLCDIAILLYITVITIDLQA